MPVAVCVPPTPLLPTRWTIQLQKSHFRDFPGSPVVKTLHFHFKGMCSIPGQGINIPTCCVGVAKKKKKNQKKQKQKNPQKTHLSIFFLRYLWYQLLYFVFPGKTPKWGFAFRNFTGALSQGEHLRSNEESKFVGGTNWAAVQVQKGICLLLGVSAPGMGPLDVSWVEKSDLGCYTSHRPIIGYRVPLEMKCDLDLRQFLKRGDSWESSGNNLPRM